MMSCMIAETKKHQWILASLIPLWEQGLQEQVAQESIPVVWMSPRMETPQPVWATCATLREKAGILLGPDETSCVSVCVVLSLGASEETNSIFFTCPSVQLSQPLLILRDVPVPYSSSLLCALIHPCLSCTGSPELGTELQIHCWLEKGHLSPSAGSTLPNTAQEAAGFSAQGHIGGSWSAWCSPGLPGHSFQQTIPITSTCTCGYCLGWCAKVTSEMHHALSEAVNKTN